MNETVLKQALGIDVSKASLSMCLGIMKSDLSKEFTPGKDVSNDKSGYKELSKWLKKVSGTGDLPTIVMEATGVYHEGIATYLYDLGYQVSILQSGRVKKYAQSLDQRSKTDALDSKMLSMLGCERSLLAWSPPSALMQTLKALSRERSALIKDKCIEKNRQGAIDSSIYSNKKEIKRFNQRLKLLNAQIAEVELEMSELTAQDLDLTKKLAYLESIPGVSFISAIIVIAETSGFALINSGKQLTSYAGYDVVMKESGTYRGKTKISKKGNRHIRAVLNMPSMTCVRVNPTLGPFYQRLKPKKAKPIVALVAVQRKLLILMYTLWKNEEYYDGEFEQKKAANLLETCCTG
ncbi:MAG: transposase [Crocinitomicaceae bacterium]|jgi:transposase